MKDYIMGCLVRSNKAIMTESSKNSIIEGFLSTLKCRVMVSIYRNQLSKFDHLYLRKTCNRSRKLYTKIIHKDVFPELNKMYYTSKVSDDIDRILYMRERLEAVINDTPSVIIEVSSRNFKNLLWSAVTLFENKKIEEANLYLKELTNQYRFIINHYNTVYRYNSFND